MTICPSLTIIIPARNEEANIAHCVDDLLQLLVIENQIDTEVIVVNDGSQDNTERSVLELRSRWPKVRLIRRTDPCGFGRAIRTGIEFATGQSIIIYMADRSDHPQDALRYFQTLQQGYDCVFGSRFLPGSQVNGYPKAKLIVNRIVNITIQWMFWTKHNDLTNAFKAYKRDVIEHCGPYRACHFNITLEMSLSALISGYKIAKIPIHWEGRTWGASKLRMREMGRRYLCTLLMLFFQRILMQDDLDAERTRNMISGVEITE